MPISEPTGVHPDDGALLALLDRELGAEAEAALAGHVRTCAECADRLARLRAAASLPGELLPLLDTDVPPVRPAALRRAAHTRARHARLAVAAGLVLLLAAGAAALVPGSPVRDWVARALGTSAGTSGAPDRTSGDDRPRSMSVAVSGDSVSVRVESTAAPIEVRVILSQGSRVSVRALDAAPSGFEVGAGIVTVRPGAARLLEVTLPRTTGPARLFLGDESLLERRGDDVRLREAAVRDDSIIRFSLTGTVP